MYYTVWVDRIGSQCEGRILPHCIYSTTAWCGSWSHCIKYILPLRLQYQLYYCYHNYIYFIQVGYMLYVLFILCNINIYNSYLSLTSYVQSVLYLQGGTTKSLLHVAAAAGHCAIVKLLLRYGAGPHIAYNVSTIESCLVNLYNRYKIVIVCVSCCHRYSIVIL